MEKKSSSLLAQIKSKYILQQILSLAFGEMKPVIKLVKYNKSLLNKLDINIKDNYKYEIETKIEKKGNCFFIYLLVIESIFSFLFLGYILLYVSGKFNDKNLKDGYNVKKKNFVDFMDNYILFAYFGFLISSMIFIIIYFCYNFFALKKSAKQIIILFIIFVDLTHYIVYIIKLSFSIKLIKKELLATYCFSCDNLLKTQKSYIIWFYGFDAVIIFFLSFYILSLILLLPPYFIANLILINDDIKKKFINQLNGINICPFELPCFFDNSNYKEKIEIIFKKENLAKYRYKSNTNKIYLILEKINDIRRKINLPLLRHLLNTEQGECLPDFIINEKTKMFFYPNENIYKLSPNFYIFKYPKDEFQNHINNKEIMDIIKNETLDNISLIEKNELEYISIYKNNPNENIQRNNNDININNNIPNIDNRPRIQSDINTNIDVANTDERLTVTEISDNEENEIGSIRNITINKNAFQEK